VGRRVAKQIRTWLPIGEVESWPLAKVKCNEILRTIRDDACLLVIELALFRAEMTESPIPVFPCQKGPAKRSPGMGYLLERWKELQVALDAVCVTFSAVGKHYEWDVDENSSWDRVEISPIRQTILCDFERAIDGLEMVLQWCGRFVGVAAEASPTERDAPRQLSDSEKQILALVRSKSLKGEVISQKLGISYDHCRRLLGRLTREGKLRNSENGYRTVKGAT
jgi:hypothetical protein